MKLQFDITREFDSDLNQLPKDDQIKVKNQINILSDSLLNGKTAFSKNSSIPYHFKLKNGLESSLFVINAENNKRIVAAVDEDPIFEKISVTLFRLIDEDLALVTYKEVGEDIYKKLGVL